MDHHEIRIDGGSIVIRLADGSSHRFGGSAQAAEHLAGVIVGGATNAVHRDPSTTTPAAHGLRGFSIDRFMSLLRERIVMLERLKAKD